MRTLLTAAVATILLGPATASAAEPLVFWGIQAEQLEWRTGDDADLAAWEAEAFAGTDELQAVWRSRGEWDPDEDSFEKLENQARLRVPVSDFFDASAGISVSTPHGPDRLYGVVGIEGLAPQWVELNADAFLSDRPFLRVEAEYEALITNRIVLSPLLEIELPLVDDTAIGAAAWGPTVELGARLGYDLVDRAISPYVGIHWERAFGDTADLRRAAGQDIDELFVVVGTRLMF